MCQSIYVLMKISPKGDKNEYGAFFRINIVLNDLGNHKGGDEQLVERSS